MTVHTLETAKELVDEMGKENVEVVFRYTHAISKDVLYAIFDKCAFVDIYTSPFCECIETIFKDGEWEDET